MTVLLYDLVDTVRSTTPMQNSSSLSKLWKAATPCLIVVIIAISIYQTSE